MTATITSSPSMLFKGSSGDHDRARAERHEANMMKIQELRHHANHIGLDSIAGLEEGEDGAGRFATIPQPPPYREATNPHRPEVIYSSTGDICFALGPNDSGMFYSRLADAGGYALDKNFIVELSVVQPYIFSINPDGGSFLACKNGDYAVTFAFKDYTVKFPNGKKQKNRFEYGALKSWVNHNFLPEEAELVTSTLTFGPNGSYYAKNMCDLTWRGLPTGLMDLLKRVYANGFGPLGPGTIRFPSHVALGADGSWFALFHDGSFAYELSSAYARFHAAIAKYGTGQIESVTFSPTEAGPFLLVCKSGFIAFYLPSNMQSMKDRALACMQRRAHEQGRSFTVRGSSTGHESVTRVTPNSSYGLCSCCHNLDEEYDEPRFTVYAKEDPPQEEKPKTLKKWVSNCSTM